jgi:methylated-DNA-[protein]-cysteine S-methyltransferase
MNLSTRAIGPHCTAQMRYASPLGTLLLARTAGGLAGAWFENQKHHPAPIDAPERDDDRLLRQAAQELEAYFSGVEDAFSVPLDLHGTPFQRAVWRELLKLDRGATCSYGEIAQRLGTPSAGRAVGAAVGRNPVSIIVPCHRVVGHDGSLTGYAGGLERKTALLRLESARIGRAAVPAQREMH